MRLNASRSSFVKAEPLLKSGVSSKTCPVKVHSCGPEVESGRLLNVEPDIVAEQMFLRFLL